MSTATRLVCFLLWDLSMTFYTFHRHRVSLVDRVDLICSLYSWWEGLGSPSLATLPLGFNCGFISTSACGSSLGVCSWSCPGGLGFVPVRARCAGNAWVTGVLAAPGTQRSWRLGQQEIQCSRRYGNQYWPIHSRFLAWRIPFPDREAWQATVHRAAKNHTLWKRPWLLPCKTFSLPVAALPQWELSLKVAQLLGLRGPWWCQVCRDTDCFHRRSYGPIRVFFQVSCSWRSEGLFGQPFSIAPPVQALRALPCLGFFSVIRCIRHIEEHPWLGSYSEDQASGT